MMDQGESAFKVHNLLALYRASLVAASSLSPILDGFHFGEPIEDYVEYSKQRIEMNIHILSARSELLHTFAVELTVDQQIDMLFGMLDVEEKGTVSTHHFLTRLKDGDHGLAVIEPMIPSLKEMSETADQMNRKRFGVLFRLFNVSASELTQFIATQLVLAETGRKVLEEAVTALVDEDCTMEVFQQAVQEARMLLLFDLLDYSNKGTIFFEDVVKHLFRITQKGMDETQRQILLLLQENDLRKVDYPAFAEFLSHVLVAMNRRSLNIHHLANAITLSICKQDVTEDDLRELFVETTTMQEAFTLEDSALFLVDESKERNESLECGKLSRLFDLWDANHDGALDWEEICVGLRKFQGTLSTEKTIGQTTQALLACDKDQDNRLDRGEFAILLSRFARAAGLDLRQLVDFMVVQTALGDTDDNERISIAEAAAQREKKLEEFTRSTSRRQMRPRSTKFGQLLFEVRTLIQH